MFRTDETEESLFQRQEEMEDLAKTMGGQRFRMKLQKAIEVGEKRARSRRNGEHPNLNGEASVGAAKRLLREGLEPVEKALQEIIDGGGRGRPSITQKWLRKLDGMVSDKERKAGTSGASIAAYLSIMVVLDSIHTTVKVRDSALLVTGLVLDEMRYRRFREKAPGLFKYAMAAFSTSSYSHRARSFDRKIHRAEVDISDLQMSQSDRLTFGTKLLETVREVTQWVEVTKTRKKVHGDFRGLVQLKASEAVLKWLDERNEFLEDMHPIYLPMVMPPLPWAPGCPGGYRFALMGKHPMVRTQSPIQWARIRATSMPEVYSALNRIQETPWRINNKVREVIEELFWKRGGGVAGLPLANDMEVPPKPHDIDTNEEAEHTWRRAAHGVWAENALQKQGRRKLFDLLRVVDRVRTEETIYFPHNMDFRGRIYPVTSFLSPQGDDMTKSLLEFAEGKPIGKEGLKFLALRGAALMDKTPEGVKLSKMTFEDRLKWVESIEPYVVAIAADPYSYRLWMEAEDPWQFLAWCFDYAGAIREGASYVSHLPVAQDGTCNGLQHFAAMWLDERGAKAVNVTPSEKPQDIYQDVADEVLKKLEADSSNPLAAMWLNSRLVDRSLCKRPVMTFSYGSERFGFAEQLKDKVETGMLKLSVGERADLLAIFSDEEGKSQLLQACIYLSALLWASLRDVSVSAFNGMAWMKSSAKAIAKGSKAFVEWTAAGTGFPVVQSYSALKVSRTETILAGTVFAPVVYQPTDVPDWKEQTSGAPPNIVHSHDAAALMLTVNQAAAEGIECFAMVHDSFGTLAADAPTMASVTRRAFYQLYTQQDVVGELYQQFLKQNPKVPPPPVKGTLDIGAVINSRYFFS